LLPFFYPVELLFLGATSMRLLSFVLCLAAVSALEARPSVAAANTAGSTPVLSFAGHVVTVDNLQPGSSAVLFAVGLIPDGYQSTVVRWAQVVADTAHAGSVQFDAGGAIPCKSIWVAADLRTGQYTVAAPDGCPLRLASLAPHPFKRNARGEIDRFFHSRPFLDFLYVSPGKGAWIIRAVDGYDAHSDGSADGAGSSSNDENRERDEDGKSDGMITVALGSARKLVKGSSNLDLVPGGILFAVDLYRLDIAAVRLDEKMLSEVGP
jgi:hypothetical protein